MQAGWQGAGAKKGRRSRRREGLASVRFLLPLLNPRPSPPCPSALRFPLFPKRRLPFRGPALPAVLSHSALPKPPLPATPSVLSYCPACCWLMAEVSQVPSFSVAGRPFLEPATVLSLTCNAACHKTGLTVYRMGRWARKPCQNQPNGPLDGTLGHAGASEVKETCSRFHRLFGGNPLITP